MNYAVGGSSWENFRHDLRAVGIGKMYCNASVTIFFTVQI